MKDSFKVAKGNPFWGRVRSKRVVKVTVTHSFEGDSRPDILEDVLERIRLLWGLDSKKVGAIALVRLCKSLERRVSMEMEMLNLYSKLNSPEGEFLVEEILSQMEALANQLEDPFKDPGEQ